MQPNTVAKTLDKVMSMCQTNQPLYCSAFLALIFLRLSNAFEKMSDNHGSAAELLKKIQLKLEKGEKRYIPEKHCIFCLGKGTKANPLSSTENGRHQVAEVIINFLFN